MSKIICNGHCMLINACFSGLICMAAGCACVLRIPNFIRISEIVMRKYNNL